MRPPLRLLLVAVATLGLAALACSGAETGSAGQDEPVRLVPRPGQVIVTGMADRVAADGAQSEPVATPFTISARERGVANLTIENALVAGRRMAINWNSGTPLPITGAGGLDLAGAHVDVDGAGITWTLDGPPRAFLPGNYRAAASVGVGDVGLADPRASVDFQADRRTVLTARGGTIVRLPPRRILVEGPGKASLVGRLRVRTPEGERAATRAELGNGPYQLTLVPVGRQLRTEAILQGRVTTS